MYFEQSLGVHTLCSINLISDKQPFLMIIQPTVYIKIAVAIYQNHYRKKIRTLSLFCIETHLQ
jgi:hypothetical protein